MQKLPVLVVSLAALPVACLAATAMPAPPPQLGRCAVCHGRYGHARTPGAPNLAGQPYRYLLKALHEYRSGKRKAQVMRTAVGPLNAKELKALARWYAEQPPCKRARAGRP